MLRTPRILIIAAVAFALSESSWAGESEDVGQVRDLLYTEMGGFLKGDPDQIISCYASGFVGYGAWGNEPELWTVGIVGLDSLRTQYAASAVEWAANFAKHPEWKYGNEVLHIDVKNDRAIALTKHWAAMPDTTARETIVGQHQSVWMLAKNDGEWKITSFIGGITFDQKIWKMPPE